MRRAIIPVTITIKATMVMDVIDDKDYKKEAKEELKGFYGDLCNLSFRNEYTASHFDSHAVSRVSIGDVKPHGTEVEE